MPVLVIVNGPIPTLLEKPTNEELLRAANNLSGVPGAPNWELFLPWLATRPNPSGWYSNRDAAIHAANIVGNPQWKAPILVGPSDVKLARQRLGMTRVQFGTAMGIGGNYNTINKAVYELETNELKELPLHKKEQLFGLLTAHELKLGKNLDGHTYVGGGYNPDTGRTEMPEFAISITDYKFPG